MTKKKLEINDKRKDTKVAARRQKHTEIGPREGISEGREERVIGRSVILARRKIIILIAQYLFRARPRDAPP